MAQPRQTPDPLDVGAGYDEVADGYDERHRSWRTVRRFERIDAPQLRIARGADRVLELGCGTGRLLLKARARSRVGVDVSRRMVAQACAQGLRAIAGSAEALPFADDTFDAVLSGNGAFVYIDYSKCFPEVARVLRPGGRMAVHQYAARTWSPRELLGQPAAEVYPTHVSDLDEIIAPARSCGFSVENTYLWRSVRVYPYALAIPPWVPGRWWNHCTIVFRLNAGR